MTAGQRVFRLALADNGAATEHTPPIGPSDDLKEESAMSGDGTKIAFVAGPNDLYRIYLLGETGGLQTLPPPPAPYEEPNYLPDNTGQSGLLLNQDGSRPPSRGPVSHSLRLDSRDAKLEARRESFTCLSQANAASRVLCDVSHNLEA